MALSYGVVTQVNGKLINDCTCHCARHPNMLDLMKIFSSLREVIRLEQHHLPFIESIEDRDIAVEIGWHEMVGGEPLTLKGLFLLDIGSVATVQRRLARLVEKDVVLKRRHSVDRRVYTLHLTPRTKLAYQNIHTQLAFAS